MHRLLGLLMITLLCETAAADRAAERKWTDNFNLASCQWSATGRNDYFVLEPGYQAVFEGREHGDPMHLEITVLNETRKIGGVETRVVEERESKRGQLVEVSRNFFAICKSTNDVFYFGEEVDMYKDGKVTTHEGSWAAEGEDKPGLFMPARPLLGSRFYQEVAPRVAMDRVEIISDSDIVHAPAGDFRDCVRTEETTPLEPGVKDYKVYAPGVGLVKDGVFLLSKRGSTKP